MSDIVDRLKNGSIRYAAESEMEAGARRHKDRQDAIAEIERLREALESVMVGGNHLAIIIGADHPPYTATNTAALHHYGAGDQYNAWCCWRVIMLARTALEAAKKEGK